MNIKIDCDGGYYVVFKMVNELEHIPEDISAEIDRSKLEYIEVRGLLTKCTVTAIEGGYIMTIIRNFKGDILTGDTIYLSFK